ncbi:DNA primase [Nocardioides sp.]|uniref:DNA primase n=1 Tax=Nocardioides sp. TaxID=35761 RepID=UPI003783311A
MAGRIREEDIAEVREKARIDDVVSQYVTLRKAGGGSLKGLCPFHDEKSPSFNVNPGRGFFHCLAGETRVLTWDGPREIRELVGGTHRILGARGDWLDAPFKSYGTQTLHRIVLTRDRQRKEIFATDGHRWFLRSGSDRRSRREVVTAELQTGDVLVSQHPAENGVLSAPGAGKTPISPPARSAQGLDRFTGERTAVLDRPSDPVVDWVVQSVESTDRVEEVFCAEVEDGHAFVLEDNILTGNCFGCGEGGDVIAFLMKIDGLTFGEAVERLADKTGVVLRREDDGRGREERPKGPQRTRLVEAHKVAQAYYAEQLATADALAARQFLSERGFDQAAASHFGIGFAPRDGEALLKHLRGRGFTQEEAVEAGLVAVGRSAYDRFRGRLLWPIRDASGDTIGFGARRIFDDDRIEAKYLNTPETRIYKKSQVLYGIDLARREIGRSSQAVIVEGYTDVMACHLAGITTAVATCGTAFGDDHARVLRRFLDDHDGSRGEVIFTFDGDAAGQKAALRAFGGDQNFVAQTYVAVEPDGLDPCDLRIKKGDEAVRSLVEGRVPLYRFVLSNVVGKYDLDRADGRVDALREGARLVSSIRDRSKVDAFSRELAGMVGLDVDEARAEVRRASHRRHGAEPATSTPTTHSLPPAREVPSIGDPRFAVERETLMIVVQHPMTIGRLSADLSADDFTHPVLRAVWDLVAAAGGVAAGVGDPGWAARLRDSASDPAVAAALSALAVAPLKKQPDAAYFTGYLVRLQELTTSRRIADVRSRLQRADPTDTDAFNALFGELARLENHRRALLDQLVGPA